MWSCTLETGQWAWTERARGKVERDGERQCRLALFLPLRAVGVMEDVEQRRNRL